MNMRSHKYADVACTCLGMSNEKCIGNAAVAYDCLHAFTYDLPAWNMILARLSMAYHEHG